MSAYEVGRTDERAGLSALVDAAHDEIHRICRGGTERWRMSIPANPERDSDLILSAALDELADHLAAAIERAGVAEAKVAAAQDALRMVARVPDMYRHLFMDTEADRALHRKVTAAADAAIAEMRRRLGATTDGEVGA